ncbi:MAG: SPFH domain-containing protein [Anaerolineales bacterium]|nr:MAG: SPFH domain-containing protein [Anaerolineales bacterium]
MMRIAFNGIGSVLRTPVGIILLTTAVWHGVLWGMEIPFNPFTSVLIFMVDIAIALFLLDRLIYFFSQFVLPIQKPRDRQEIYSRVKIFETGRRGPTLFVKNGNVIKHEGEADKRGPGVIVLDTASAVVLRTDVEIKSTVGPGIKFTEGDEYVAGSVDLRAQWQFIGPLANEQASVNRRNSRPAQEKRSHDTSDTSGLTRDGFEVSPTISIKFSIKRPIDNRPSESGVTSQYGYDPAAVRNAVTREVIRHGAADNSKSRMDWNNLPAHLVVNIWREYIRKFKMDELFTAQENEISKLQTIEDMINKRVRQSNAMALDDTGLPSGEWVESLEYKQLQARGLEILEVRIHNVLFDPSIEEQQIQQWNAEWMKLAVQEEKFLNEKEALIETAARDESCRNFARIVSQKFDNPLAPMQDTFTTLRDLVEPLKESILAESAANDEREMEIRKLDEIWRWVLDNSLDASNGQGGSG